MLPTELEEAVYMLKPGEVSQPVRSTYEYHLAKLTALVPEKRTSRSRSELPEPELWSCAEITLRPTRSRFFATGIEAISAGLFPPPSRLAPCPEAYSL